MSTTIVNLIASSESNCCGCLICANICPAKAISINNDSKGFNYPKVDSSCCIHCGMCEKHCPLLQKESIKHYPIVAYMAKHKENRIRCLSSSGGVFSALATHIIDLGGVVYGAAYSDGFTVKHVRVESKDELYLLRGSKYVQSDMSSAINFLKIDLNNGRPVLFSGTPCQIHAISLVFDSFRSSGQLLCVDIICHGVPSPKLFRDHISSLENKYGPISKYRSRSKLEGWHSSNDRMITENGRDIRLTNNIQSFWMLFKSNLCLRECCYTCQYSSINRVGDITIGDYWGVEKYHKEFDDNKGTSLILVNTAAGQHLFSSIVTSIDYIVCGLDEIMQPHLEKPCIKPSLTDDFWNDYLIYGYHYIEKKYGKQKLSRIIKRIIKRLIFLFYNKNYIEEME